MKTNITESCIDAISVLSTLRFPPADLEKTAQGWVGMCARHEITPDELGAATVALYESCREFPAPVDVLTAVEGVRAQARMASFTALVPCVDGQGDPILAHPDKVREGVYVGDVPALGGRS
jgi:hypothetical protein